MEAPKNVLARIRTVMANERTLMSYYRSSIASVGLAAIIFKFYPSTITAIYSVFSVIIAVMIAIFGTLRYLRVRERLERIKK